MKALYKTFPSGNREDLPWLDKAFKDRGVPYYTADLPGGGFVVLVDSEEVGKLPTDVNGPYFGGSERGFSAYWGDKEQFDGLNLVMK